MKKDLAYYRSLPYSRIVTREAYDDEAWFVVEVEELPGLTAAGKTRAEAMVEMDKAFDSYIEANLAWGEDLPEPEPVLSKKSEEVIRRSFPFRGKTSNILLRRVKEQEDQLVAAGSGGSVIGPDLADSSAG